MTVDALTVGLGINSTKSIMTMDKPVIKEIKKHQITVQGSEGPCKPMPAVRCNTTTSNRRQLC